MGEGRRGAAVRWKLLPGRGSGREGDHIGACRRCSGVRGGGHGDSGWQQTHGDGIVGFIILHRFPTDL